MIHTKKEMDTEYHMHFNKHLTQQQTVTKVFQDDDAAKSTELAGQRTKWHMR